MGGTSGLCIAKDCQQVFFLCSPAPLSLPFSLLLSLNLICHTHWSVNFEKWIDQKHSLNGHIVIPYLFFLCGGWGFDHSPGPNQSICYGNYTERYQSKLSTTERWFQQQSIATQVWMRFPLWQAREFEGPPRRCKSFITAEEEHWMDRRET